MRPLILILAGVALWMMWDREPTLAADPVAVPEPAEVRTPPTELAGATVSEQDSDAERETVADPDAFVVDDLVAQADRLFVHREFKRALETARKALRHDPNDVDARTLLIAAAKALLVEDPDAKVHVQLDEARVRSSFLGISMYESVPEQLKRIDVLTGFPIILSPEGKELLRDHTRILVPKDPAVRTYLNELCRQHRRVGWLVRDGVVVVTSAEKARGEK